MKTIIHLWILGLLPLFFSCRPSNEKENRSVVAVDTMVTKFELQQKEHLEKRTRIKENKKIDNSRLDKVLSDALIIAKQNLKKDNFQKKYQVSPDNEYDVKVKINSGYYFTKDYPHLIIRRSEPGNIHIDIYSKKDDVFTNVISHKQWTLTYMNDTIRDINGDGLKDFVVNWYGASGCCLKAFSNVYLIRPDKKTFSRNFEFINPTFSPEEKIIRGVCYGHPGDTEMYKYKWNAEAVDTLEYIYYETDDKGLKTGKIISSNDKHYSKKEKNIKLLNAIPREYKHIEGYDWFTGTGYK